MDLKFRFLLLLLVIFKGKINALRCYVCSEESLLPCLNFDFEKEKFIQQCDHSQKGCFLKIEGNNKTRSCVDKKIDDCQIANGVEYCFCSSDLCNVSSRKFSDLSDDEDLIEGSGTKVTFEEAKVKKINKQNYFLQNTTVVYVHSLSITSSACMYLILLCLMFYFSI